MNFISDGELAALQEQRNLLYKQQRVVFEGKKKEWLKALHSKKRQGEAAFQQLAACFTFESLFDKEAFLPAIKMWMAGILKRVLGDEAFVPAQMILLKVEEEKKVGELFRSLVPKKIMTLYNAETTLVASQDHYKLSQAADFVVVCPAARDCQHLRHRSSLQFTYLASSLTMPIIAYWGDVKDDPMEMAFDTWAETCNTLKERGVASVSLQKFTAKKIDLDKLAKCDIEACWAATLDQLNE